MGVLVSQEMNVTSNDGAYSNLNIKGNHASLQLCKAMQDKFYLSMNNYQFTPAFVASLPQSTQDLLSDLLLSTGQNDKVTLSKLNSLDNGQALFRDLKNAIALYYKTNKESVTKLENVTDEIFKNLRSNQNQIKGTEESFDVTPYISKDGPTSSVDLEQFVKKNLDIKYPIGAYNMEDDEPSLLPLLPQLGNNGSLISEGITEQTPQIPGNNLSTPANSSTELDNKIAHKIWENESGATNEGLLAWNPGEEMASMGIGHCIWYPSGVTKTHGESFKQSLEFAQSRGEKIPEFLIDEKTGRIKDCPWQKEEFKELVSGKRQNSDFNKLRTFMENTKVLQYEFIKDRLDKFYVANKESAIGKTIGKMLQSEAGVYALTDYVNFKGEGTLSKPSWGLVNVLTHMNVNGSMSSKQLVAEFASSAIAVLHERRPKAWGQKDSPGPGWVNRINTYPTFSSNSAEYRGSAITNSYSEYGSATNASYYSSDENDPVGVVFKTNIAGGNRVIDFRGVSAMPIPERISFLSILADEKLTQEQVEKLTEEQFTSMVSQFQISMYGKKGYQLGNGVTGISVIVDGRLGIKTFTAMYPDRSSFTIPIAKHSSDNNISEELDKTIIDELNKMGITIIEKGDKLSIKGFDKVVDKQKMYLLFAQLLKKSVTSCMNVDEKTLKNYAEFYFRDILNNMLANEEGLVDFYLPSTELLNSSETDGSFTSNSSFSGRDITQDPPDTSNLIGYDHNSAEHKALFNKVDLIKKNKVGGEIDSALNMYGIAEVNHDKTKNIICAILAAKKSEEEVFNNQEKNALRELFRVMRTEGKIKVDGEKIEINLTDISEVNKQALIEIVKLAEGDKEGAQDEINGILAKTENRQLAVLLTTARVVHLSSENNGYVPKILASYAVGAGNASSLLAIDTKKLNIKEGEPGGYTEATRNNASFIRDALSSYEAANGNAALDIIPSTYGSKDQLPKNVSEFIRVTEDYGKHLVAGSDYTNVPVTIKIKNKKDGEYVDTVVNLYKFEPKGKGPLTGLTYQLDAGHQGPNDTGAKYLNGSVSESALNRMNTIRLAERLCEQGATVITDGNPQLTSTQQTYIPSGDRDTAMNKYMEITGTNKKDSVMMSIHSNDANGSAKLSASGMLVLYRNNDTAQDKLKTLEHITMGGELSFNVGHRIQGVGSGIFSQSNATYAVLAECGFNKDILNLIRSGGYSDISDKFLFNLAMRLNPKR